MSKQAIDIIKDYLDERAKNDALFAEKYANPKKNINECWHYIVGEASKQSGDCVAMSDEEVFGLAVHYYDEEDIKIVELSKRFKGSSASNPEEKLTEEEIQEAKEIAKERAVRRMMEEQQKMLHKPKKKKEEPQQSMMGDLFG